MVLFTNITIFWYFVNRKSSVLITRHSKRNSQKIGSRCRYAVMPSRIQLHLRMKRQADNKKRTPSERGLLSYNIKISAVSPQKTNFVMIRQVYRLDLSEKLSLFNLLKRLPRLFPVACRPACPFVSITVAETQCRIYTGFRFCLDPGLFFSLFYMIQYKRPAVNKPAFINCIHFDARLTFFIQAVTSFYATDIQRSAAR